MLVLYFEDNPLNRTLVRRIVTTAGWRFEEAENGRVGLTRLQREPRPDVILMDLAMPVLDGYRATQMIKSDPTLADIPVVAVTAHTMPGDRKRALAAGCDAYLTKPLDQGRFLEELERWLPPPPAEEAWNGLCGAVERLAADGRTVDLAAARRFARALAAAYPPGPAAGGSGDDTAT